MNYALDIFFYVFHSGLILFNLFGWIWKQTRRINLITLSLTAFSWFVLGIWYGIGYCPFTEWHWNVRRELGHRILTSSYIKFLLDSIIGFDFDPIWVDYMTVLFFVSAFVLSAFANYRDWRS